MNSHSKPNVKIELLQNLTAFDGKPDRVKVAEIASRSFPNGGFDPKNFWSMLEKGEHPSHCVVARLAADEAGVPKGAIVGFLVYQEMPSALLISNMAVDENFRHAGIAHALMDELRQVKPTHKPIKVYFHEDNKTLAELLTRLGFAEAGIQANWYGKSMHARAMEYKAPELPRADEPPHDGNLRAGRIRFTPKNGHTPNRHPHGEEQEPRR